MILPRLMLVTYRASMHPNSLQLALEAGARWIQWRELESDAFQVLADVAEAENLCAQHDAILSVNATHGTDFGNVHWPQRFLHQPQQRAPNLNGYSVHDIAAAQLAAQNGADYILFGHVFSTLSHDEEPRGLDALRKVCASVDVPVLAIGGISAQNAQSCLQAGAYGIAVMRGVWRGDVETQVRDLLNAIEA